jgi:hypothetical protein
MRTSRRIETFAVFVAPTPNRSERSTLVRPRSMRVRINPLLIASPTAIGGLAAAVDGDGLNAVHG